MAMRPSPPVEAQPETLDHEPEPITGAIFRAPNGLHVTWD